MSLDGKLMAQARIRHSENKAEREAKHRGRQREAYAAAPRLQEIDTALRETVQAVIHIALDGAPDPEARLSAIGAKSEALQEEARTHLTAAGFPADYLDDIPHCPICDDTGHDGPRVCACLMDIYRRLQTEELSNLLNLGAEHFDAFSLDYYDHRTVDPRFGTTSRENMEMNYQICHRYATTFGPHSQNLFLVGAPGLGKTFLSSCIAKVVAESGYSVVYDTAGSLFRHFETAKFGRGDEAEETREEVDRYQSCDLLILDDLGTELTTSFVVSALYELINTRLLRKKQTVISSNYSLEALADKYTPQIMSRLEGEYEILTFFGQDIRKLKKESLS